MRRLPFFYGWVIVAASALLAFLGTGLFSYTRGVFLPSLAETFGGRFEVALAFSIETVVAAAFAPFLGRVLDRHSPRRVMTAGTLVVALGYYLLSRCDEAWQLYLVMGVLFGLGMAAMGTIPWQKVVVTWFERRRGLALALGVMGASVAGVVMPPVANELISTFGWRGGFQGYSLLVLLVLFPATWILMRDRPEDMGEAVDGRREPAADAGAVPPPPGMTTREILGTPAFWAIALIFSAMLCVLGAVLLHLYGHLLDIGVGEARAALAVSAMAGAAALGKPVIGWLSDVLGVRRSVWLSLAVQVLSLVTLATAADSATAMAAAVVYGFGYSGLSSLQSLAVGSVFGSASFGRARGLLVPVMLPVTMAASPFAGLIHDTFGSYSLAFLSLTGLLVVAMLGPLLLPGGPARGAVARA